MSRRRLRRRAVERLVANRVAEAIVEYERNVTNPEGAGGERGAGARNAKGIIAPEGRRCSYKTFLNEQEMWNFTMKKDDIDGYTNYFHELAVTCPTLVTPEYKKIEQKIERYIWGLPERVQGNVTSSKPTTIHEAVTMALGLVDQSVRAKATRISESNKKSQWPPKCRKFQRSGHQKSDCRVKTLVIGSNTQKSMTCFRCRENGHYRNKCPKRKDQQNEGMDLLSNHLAEIICYEKIVHIPLSNGETLEIQGERPKKDPKPLSCMKTDEKKLRDIPIVRNFLEVFLDALSGLPPTRKVEFRIDLIPRVMPVARSPYRLTPFIMQDRHTDWHLPKCKDRLTNSKSSKTRVLFDRVIPHG
nr:putative reverse transcriptase domain-containing protein [Tanacetum cinerariifolium]